MSAPPNRSFPPRSPPERATAGRGGSRPPASSARPRSRKPHALARLQPLRTRLHDRHQQQALLRLGEIFGDEVTAVAMIDRLVHHAKILSLKGDSYRCTEETWPPDQPPTPPTSANRHHNRPIPSICAQSTPRKESTRSAAILLPPHKRAKGLPLLETGPARPPRPASATRGRAGRPRTLQPVHFQPAQPSTFQPALPRASQGPFARRTRLTGLDARRLAHRING
jgi:hypothetical protein